jgi:spermidine synthase
MGYLRLTSTRFLLAAGGLAVILGLGLSAFSHVPRAHGEAEAEQDEGGFLGQSVLEFDYQSKYSHFKVTRENSTRTLWFVRDNGEEVVESQVDIERPYALLVEYTRFMFASYLLRPNPDRVLIVGLGGGAMPHFITRYDRKVKVDVVEIDPAIIQVAAKYFGVRSGGNLKITNADGLDYLKNTKTKYDVIYMDAFLKPSDDTDDTGVPVRMKTVNFYKAVQQKLNPDGIVVFNLNPHSGQADDVKMIREAFPSTYVFKLNFGGLVMVASTSEQHIPTRKLDQLAAQLDRRFRATFSFRGMIERLVR